MRIRDAIPEDRGKSCPGSLRSLREAQVSQECPSFSATRKDGFAEIGCCLHRPEKVNSNDEWRRRIGSGTPECSDTPYASPLLRGGLGGNKCKRGIPKSFRHATSTNEMPMRADLVERRSGEKIERIPADPSCPTPSTESLANFSNRLKAHRVILCRSGGKCLPPRFEAQAHRLTRLCANQPAASSVTEVSLFPEDIASAHLRLGGLVLRSVEQVFHQINGHVRRNLQGELDLYREMAACIEEPRIDDIGVVFR